MVRFRRDRQTDRSHEIYTNERLAWIWWQWRSPYRWIVPEWSTRKRNTRRAFSPVNVTLSVNVNTAMSLTSLLSYRYREWATTRSIGTSNGVAPSSISGSKSRSPKRTTWLSEQKPSIGGTVFSSRSENGAGKQSRRSHARPDRIAFDPTSPIRQRRCLRTVLVHWADRPDSGRPLTRAGPLLTCRRISNSVPNRSRIGIRWPRSTAKRLKTRERIVRL